MLLQESGALRDFEFQHFGRKFVFLQDGHQPREQIAVVEPAVRDVDGDARDV
ncbi:hypothetical protein D3C73_1330830 [compost metagenome]